MTTVRHFITRCVPRAGALLPVGPAAPRWLLLALVASSLQAPTTAQEAKDAAPEDAVAETAAEAPELPLRLLDRDPFDRITLDAANASAVIETVLLDMPDRRVPDSLPTEGSLKLRRLSHPSIPYEVDWSAIDKIELYEQMLLAEAERLTAAAEYAEAFQYYSFLATNYAQLPALEAALQSHLWREASTAYAAGNRDQAWPVLQALYLRNPQYPRLAGAVQAVSDDLITARLKQKNFAAARAVVDALEQTFPKVPLENVARWRTRFQDDAQEQMTKAREAFAAEQFSEARDAVTMARAILPTIDGGEALWKQIQTTAPEIRVGVVQMATPPGHTEVPTWPAERVAGVADPRLVKMADFGAEGGMYASEWGELTTSDDGLKTTVRLSPAAILRGLTPAAVALQLAEMARPDSAQGHEDLASLAKSVSIAGGQDVIIHWRRPHVRPEAFLQAPLRWITTAERSPGLWFEPMSDGDPSREQRYQRTGPRNAAANEPRFIVEQVFDDDEAAAEALIRGDVDVLDRVPPWQVERIGEAEGIVVAPYRLPTIHVLIPNFKNPLLQSRDFRRAILYGIDSESIVEEILLAGQSRPGFRTLSGPFPAGSSLSDPVGYAYNNDIAPRPYEPRLAALLSGVARQTLAKREADAKKAEQAAKAAAEKKPEGSPPSEEQPSEEPPGEKQTVEKPPVDEPPSEEPPKAVPPADDKSDSEPKPPPPDPLILAHSAEPLASLACQSIKIQLDSVGIPVKLVQFTGAAPPADLEYDLLYAELAVWEPLLDARRLLGRGGVARRTSPLIDLALDDLARSENWNQARAQLNEIHRIAHYDLPLLPLWQTVNHFAYRKSLEGVGATPVSLYQNLSAWRKSFQ